MRTVSQLDVVQRTWALLTWLWLSVQSQSLAFRGPRCDRGLRLFGGGGYPTNRVVRVHGRSLLQLRLGRLLGWDLPCPLMASLVSVVESQSTLLGWSRSGGLKRLRQHVMRCLTAICSRRSPDGWWSKHGRLRPSWLVARAPRLRALAAEIRVLGTRISE